MSTLQKISVILNNPADWDEWIEIIKIQALASKVWQHFDPFKDTIPALKEPVAPTPAQINAAKTMVTEFTLDERKQYKILQQDYK